MENGKLLDVNLSRIVVREGADRQYIYLTERNGKRGFPIVIGNNEAGEIQRVVYGHDTERPLTHQLAHDTIRALGATIRHVAIVDLKHNTFYAQVVLENEAGDELAVVDARPSDAIALALRARCPIRVADFVMRRASYEEDEAE